MSQIYTNQIKIKTKSIQFRKYSIGTLNSLLEDINSKTRMRRVDYMMLRNFIFCFFGNTFKI